MNTLRKKICELEKELEDEKEIVKDMSEELIRADDHCEKLTV